MMMFDVVWFELFGLLMMVGVLVFYWVGSFMFNFMCYSGVNFGGIWLVLLVVDFGVDCFDGVYLVENFEKFNLVNIFWSKYYNFWVGVDQEVVCFLEFECWWGGFF